MKSQSEIALEIAIHAHKGQTRRDGIRYVYTSY